MKRLALLFGMSENERRGFLVLSILIGLIGIVPFLYSVYTKQTVVEEVLISRIVAEELETLAPYSAAKRSDQIIAGESAVGIRTAEELFPFDPNNLSEAKWKMLGFTEKQIRVIKNYESKGGQFRTKADVAKLYVVSAEHFERLAPYIRLPETIPASPRVAESWVKGRTTTEKVKLHIDLSIADTAALQQIWGIGSVLASRILKFREALGGFHQLEQVKEVYGISDEQFEKMQPLLFLGDKPLKKIAVNQLTAAQLAQHPYISHKEAMHIVSYREQHGAFTSETDLTKLYALTDDFLRKIAPYLDFN